MLSVAWAVASGLGVLVLGLLSMMGGRSRPRGALPFGLFALGWGAHIVLGNLASAATSIDVVRDLTLIFLILLFPLPYFLLEFAATHAPTARGSDRWRLARYGAGSLALVNAAIFLAFPSLLLEGVTRSSLGNVIVSWGPLYLPMVLAPFFVAFGITLLALYLSRVESPTPRLSRRATIPLAGLGLYVGFAAGNNLGFYGTHWALWGPTTQKIGFSALFLGLLVVAGLIGLALLREGQRATDPGQRKEAYLAAGAILLPLAWGLGEGVVAASALWGIQTVGFWRLAGVAVIAYGIARWRLFDLPQRTRRLAAPSVGVAGAAAGGAATYGTVAVVASAPVLPATAGVLAFIVALAPGLSYARRLFGLEDAPSDTTLREELFGQRIDAYRAALEASMARGTLDEDEEFLAALRSRFRITKDHDEVLRHLARGAVMLPVEGGAVSGYERLRLLGEGTGGRTWLARDRARDGLVVLKEPLEHWQREEGLRERVLQEARMATRVRHPNLVHVHEVIEEEGRPVLVMEYVDGGSLAEVLRHRGVLPWQEALNLMLGVLDGLEALHDQNIIHRDVKPANILLSGEGRAKLADFGIAQRAAQTGTVVEGTPGWAGTPDYMPPEVRDRRAAHGEATDVYACAAVLHEALHGSPPLEGPTVTVDNAVPEPLKAVLSQALASDPGRRYNSARELAEALEGVRHG